MDFIQANWVQVTAAAGLVVGAARIIIKLTPTQADDAWFTKYVEPVLKWLALSVTTKGK